MGTDCSCFAIFIALLIISDKSKSNSESIEVVLNVSCSLKCDE